jgi:hypothetical protein
MTDFSQYKHVGSMAGINYYIADHDILLVVPPIGYVDTPQLAQQCADFMNEYISKAGGKFATVVIMSNVLTQDAETRRVYQKLSGNGLYFGVALVVDSALSRALASFIIGLSKPAVPTQLFGTVEKSIEWLRTIRPA